MEPTTLNPTAREPLTPVLQAIAAAPGDGPPTRPWPLYLAAFCWAAWMVFLIVMMVLRMRASAH